MGCLGSKDKLTKEDMEFLKSHTRYDEATIKEWYKGFKVSFACTDEDADGYLVITNVTGEERVTFHCAHGDAFHVHCYAKNQLSLVNETRNL